VARDPHIRSAVVSRTLTRVRGAVHRIDHALFGLEVVNSTADGTRGPEHWARMRAESTACFVLSTGRTGTMCVTAMLGASPSVDAQHEPEPRLIAASYLAWAGAEDAAFWEDAVTVARDRLVFAAHKRGKLYFEASNRMTFLAPALAAVYPRAKFLLVVRRPEAFIRSAVQRGYYLGHPWDHARPRPRDEPAWSGWSAERRAAWLWETTNRFGLEFRASTGTDRVDVLHAEDLFAQDADRAVRLFEFLGIEPLPRDRLTEIMRRPLNAQKGSMPWGRDVAWSDSERGGVLSALAPLVEALGYAG
jgi:hypothetical protein